MIIRKVEKSDNKYLATLIKNVFEEHNAPKEGTVYSDPATDHLFELFQKQKSVLWVAEVEGKIVGCCGVYPTEGLPEQYAELAKFYLSKGSRGKGIGRKLMESSVQSARELGYKELYIESLPEFYHAVQLYEKQGFVRLNNALGSSGHTSCNIWMLKKLD